jgi:hypothetical protein
MNYKIFGYTNFKYVDMAEYWSRYMQKLDLDYTVYCTDKKSFDYLTDKNIKCDFYGELSQDDFDFTQFGLVRFNILEQLLDQYDYVIYSDIDAIWLEDPLEDIFNDSYNAHVSTVHNPNAYPASVRKKWGMTICTGWMGFSKSCRSFILDFIGQYYSFKEGNDQQRFNEFLYSINKKIDKTVDGHSFVLDLHKYQLKVLGISRSLIHRGKTVKGSKVVHLPITRVGTENKLKALRNEFKGYIYNDKS